jgi:hypothetical protein
VSAEEYGTLTEACVSSGARSISDFARAASLQRVRELSAPSTLSGDLSTLSTELGELDATLLGVSKRIRGLLGSVQTGRDDQSAAAG